MSYENQKILRDQNGHPIPQWFDPETNQFKPLGDLTKVQTIARKTITIRTHDSVNVPSGQTNMSDWINSDGFESVALTLLVNIPAPVAAIIQWSEDGINIDAEEVMMSSNVVLQARCIDTKTKACYFRVIVNNTGVEDHIITTKCYLKA